MTRSKVHGRFKGRTFQDCDVDLDGSSFVDCRFTGCHMVYAGGALPVLSDCQFDDCSWSFAGEAANTIAFLSGFYNGGLEDLIERTFHQIRKGAMIMQEDAPESKRPDYLHGARPIFGLPGPKLFKVAKRK